MNYKQIEVNMKFSHLIPCTSCCTPILGMFCPNLQGFSVPMMKQISTEVWSPLVNGECLVQSKLPLLQQAKVSKR